MEYITLTQDEKDDVIVSFMHQQEMDHLCHSINKERYDFWVKNGAQASNTVKNLVKKSSQTK